MTPMPPPAPLDDLLARARLLETPVIPHDIVPGALGHDPLVGGARQHDRTRTMAARDLRTLCETVLAHTTSDSLQEFVTEHLPEPPGARVLGCVLQLADAADSARSWWQYAAGAGDDLASYCLYLQHLVLGDADAAAWWREQTNIGTRPSPEPLTASHEAAGAPTAYDTGVPAAYDACVPVAYDASFPTVLRALTHLDRTALPRTELADAVMHYVPGAVTLGYVDNPDFELPLPRPDFAEHMTMLLAATTARNAAATTAANTATNTWPRPPAPHAQPRPPRLPRRGAGGERPRRGNADPAPGTRH
ncbi:hypothetical protein [Streptomyces heilongjiangensis]|uniref:Uncharacterized protein n=1 Tax=Streptomyces heilongjiangensis TaxID=945052 RepID=A0ABW1B2Y5_9ACTN|nr:hypothetical protein [Streptomyces heilongjiangensis]MDC2950007.1 hypothetical protein [Streptomyces heilongjiangensis]